MSAPSHDVLPLGVAALPPVSAGLLILACFPASAATGIFQAPLSGVGHGFGLRFDLSIRLPRGKPTTNIDRLMSSLRQFRLFAAYNKLMNRRLFEAAGKLTIAGMSGDRGAFFGSVLGTLNHILVGDIIWLNRFRSYLSCADALDYLDQLEHPESLRAILFDDLASLQSEREKIDDIIIDWITRLDEGDLTAQLSYKNMAGLSQNNRLEDLISHLFLHQVHHRGQVTTLISQSNVDFGDTDILEILEDYST